MSKEGERASVFRTTQVRTKLKGDSSWMQRGGDDVQANVSEEKPWMAEVRANRSTQESSPELSSTPAPAPAPVPAPVNTPKLEKTPSSGYLIRGVFTKTDSKPTSSKPTTNGFRSSPTLVRPAPELQRASVPVPSEGQLSPEEQEKRTEAASSVLKKSSIRQRSYVLSAAKKFESTDREPDTLLTGSPSFVAKRVAITDEEESVASSATKPAVSPAPAPAPTPVPPPALVPEATAPQTPVNTSVNTVVVEQEVKEVPPVALETPAQEAIAMVVSVTEDDTLVLVTPATVEEEEEQEEEEEEEEQEQEEEEEEVADNDPFKDMKPGCTKVDTPLPVLILEPEEKEEEVEAPQIPKGTVRDKLALWESAAPAPVVGEVMEPEMEEEEDEDLFRDMKPGCTKVDTPLPMLILEPEEKEEEVEAPQIPKGTVRDKLALWESAAPAPVVGEVTVKMEPVEEPFANQTCFITETLPASSTLISFDTSSISLLDSQIQENEPSPTSQVAESGEEEPVPELSNCIVMTDDLLALTGGPDELEMEPVPTSPGRWSQDLLGGPESLSGPVNSSLDLLADDVIPINTEAHRLSTDTKEESNGWYQKSTDILSPTETFTTRTIDIRLSTDTKEESNGWYQKSTDILSPTETFTTRTIDISREPEPTSWGPQVTTTTTTVITSSSTDPFDPYPIGTASPNSSSDPTPPLPACSINSSADLMSSTSPAEGDLISGFSERTNAFEALADDVIPIDTDTKSLSSRRSWARTWETDTSAEESVPHRPEEVSASRGEDQQTLVMFERKSLENDSPWDRWTSPTVFTVTTEEDEQAEESPGETETQTVTTVTTIRETYSDPEPAMDRSDAYYRTVTSEDSQRTQTPEPKKPFVYVKEYLDATDLSSHNATAGLGSNAESSTSTCTYCGELVGNDAKITIEHLNINCHPDCFKCGMCSRPMGDLIYSMFLHGGTVHCESCYSRTLD